MSSSVICFNFSKPATNSKKFRQSQSLSTKSSLAPSSRRHCFMSIVVEKLLIHLLEPLRSPKAHAQPVRAPTTITPNAATRVAAIVATFAMLSIRCITGLLPTTGVLRTTHIPYQIVVLGVRQTNHESFVL